MVMGHSVLKYTLKSILFAGLNVVNMIRKSRIKVGVGTRVRSIINYFSSVSCALADRFWLLVQPLKLSLSNCEKLH